MTFWGVRGSTPVSGPEFARFGGATSCVAIATDDDELPRLVLDAGTGLVNLGRRFAERSFAGAILLTHVHWDHVQGLPFFFAADRPTARVDVHLPVAAGAESAEDVLGGLMRPPYFPIGPHGLRGTWTFTAVESGPFECEGFMVTALDVPHKGGRTVGYRIEDGTASVAYVPDHRPTALGPGPDGWGEYDRAALRLAADVDVLVHGGPYRGDELAVADAFGHSTIPYALGLARQARARRLVITHHAPLRTDDELDELRRAAESAPVPVTFAAERLTVDVG